MVYFNSNRKLRANATSYTVRMREKNSHAQHSTATTEQKKLNRNPAQTQNQASTLLSLFRFNVDKW